jgi:DNA-binding NarL/FixJ family response regulator
MASQFIDEKLIDALYGTALRDGNWRPALDRFRNLLNSAETAFTVMTGGPSLVAVETTGRVLTPEVRKQYADHFAHVDPKLVILAARSPGYLFNDVRHFDDKFVASDPFYQDYSRRLGTRHTLDMLLRRSGGRAVYLAAMRTRGAGPYDRDIERFFRQASAHFFRAFALREKMNRLQRSGDALDQLEFGIIVVDACRRVVLLNRIAEQHVREGTQLFLRNGQIFARSPSGDQQLQALIDVGLAGNRATGSVRLACGESGSQILWTVPLLESGPIASVSAPAILLVLTDAARHGPHAADVAAVYGLTDGETRVALAIAEGCTLQTIAARGGVKYSTVRTQLFSIMRKMGVHRQADVTRLLVSLARKPVV